MKARYLTPAVTPLDSQRNLDYEALERLYDHLIDGGIDGILILGSIGEFFALTMEQKKELIRFAVKKINKRVQLIVGATSMIYDEIVEIANFANREGADASMVIPPYYFWLNDQSIEEYYDRLARDCRGKLYIYNFPDRTGYDIAPDVILRLRQKHENIVGVKDTLAGVDHTRRIIDTVKPFYPEFEVYSGFDDNFAHNVLAGGDGCIGGLSNVVPELFHKWVTAFREDDLSMVAEIQQKVDRLMSIYNVGMPFVPYIKKAMQLRGVGVKPYCTIPLPTVTVEQGEKVARIMRENGIL
jgi:4-hydroxy-tetrahydrodipicolinate synthase